jgi:hypothetical protein
LRDVGESDSWKAFCSSVGDAREYADVGQNQYLFVNGAHRNHFVSSSQVD